MTRYPQPLPLSCGLLPAVATVIGLYMVDEALVAVLLYHAGILACIGWKKFPMNRIVKGFHFWWFVGMGFLCFLTWPLLTILWPIMAFPEVELGVLLVQWRITGAMVWGFVIYSITVHPVLEEVFWRGMMPQHWESDCLFAGFHLLVLASLVHLIWLPLAFFVLVLASCIWRRCVKKVGGVAVPILTHAVADLGVILAVWSIVM